jgi:hypothetical protein
MSEKSGEDIASKVKYLGTKKLKQSDIDFMKLIEQQNFERVKKLQRTRRNNIITGLVLGTGVLGIYAYSMLAVQQEKFLDDFEEPKKEKVETN